MRKCTYLCALLVAPELLAQKPIRFDSGTVSGLPARNIGSAEMSGRIAAVDAVNDAGRLTVFAASASGGVWKSVNGGSTFKPVFAALSESITLCSVVASRPSRPNLSPTPATPSRFPVQTSCEGAFG